MLLAKAQAEAEARQTAAALVGDQAAGDREQPGQGLTGVRQLVDPAPSDAERFGHDVLGIGLGCDAAQGVSQDT